LKLFGGGSLAALAVCQAPVAFAQAGPLYKDARAPIPARVADLMARMTLPEKIAQIRAAWQSKGDMIDDLAFNPTKASAAFPDGIGHITRASDKRGARSGQRRVGQWGRRRRSRGCEGWCGQT